MKRKYAVILGSLGRTKDRFCDAYKDSPDQARVLEQVAAIPHMGGVELTGGGDVTPDGASAMKKRLSDLGLRCASVMPDLFSDRVYSMGAFTSTDKSIRRKAVDCTKKVCDIALAMECDLVNVWSGQDGYDYLLCTDYDRQRSWMREGLAEVAAAYPGLKIALEYKAKEPRTHSLLARMADTVLMAQETGCPNVGVTIDTGHAFFCGENVAEVLVMAQRAQNKLYHMHFNDNHGSWDDDMIVGSVHTICYLEMLYWLDRTGYDGWLSMDQYPYREHSINVIHESIEWLVRFDEILAENRATIDRLVSLRDPVETSRFLRTVFAGRTQVV